jgi:hypothetical protein
VGTGQLTTQTSTPARSLPVVRLSSTAIELSTSAVADVISPSVSEPPMLTTFFLATILLRTSPELQISLFRQR